MGTVWATALPGLKLCWDTSLVSNWHSAALEQNYALCKRTLHSRHYIHAIQAVLKEKPMPLTYSLLLIRSSDSEDYMPKLHHIAFLKPYATLEKSHQSFHNTQVCFPWLTWMITGAENGLVQTHPHEFLVKSQNDSSSRSLLGLGNPGTHRLQPLVLIGMQGLRGKECGDLLSTSGRRRGGEKKKKESHTQHIRAANTTGNKHWKRTQKSGW